LTKTLLTLATLVLAAVPLAGASGYVGPGCIVACDFGAGYAILCDPGVGYAVGGGCDFACASSCTVTVSDVTGDPQFQVCDYDAGTASDVNCVTATGSVAFTSATSDIDVMVINGAFGEITVS